MNRPWAALGLVLALCVIMPRSAQAQGSVKPGRPTVGQSYPNPMNPQTKAPFTVGGYTAGANPPCADAGRQYRVTAKIYNALGQMVAIPVLFGGAGGMGGTPIDRIQLTCGAYTLRWEGKTLNGREAASGIYRLVIDQDGVQASTQLVVGK
ncbi:MAG: hypothetical protein H7Z40_09130 [Phycisphaerae bacterium]|nr:hypothetical protein [Gemmatimonadaceae bacterium]